MSAAAPGEAPTGGEHRLGALNRRAILGRIEQGAIVVLPVASLEQHGDHLPVSTDALLVEEVSLRAARQAGSAPDILVAPPLWTGFSPHHIPFGATVSLPAQTFLTLVGDVVAALRLWVPRVMIVNGHGGNRGPLITLALEAGCPLVSYWEPVATEIAALFPGDASIGHAGEAETGMMLAAFPQLVGEPAASFETPPDADLLLPDMGRSGVIGNPRAARAEAGEAFLALAAQGLLDHIELIFPTRRKGS